MTLPRRTSSRARVNELVVKHYEWAAKIANATARRLPTIDRDDAIGEAMLALIGSARRWRPKKGAPFKSFAQRRIVGAVLDLQRKNDPAGRDLRDKIEAGEKIEQAVPYHVWGDPAELERQRRISVAVRPRQEASAEVALLLARIVRLLSPRQQAVAIRHALNDETLAEIGADLGVTESRVCQIWKEAQRVLFDSAGVDEAA